jgi:hypothetical protein
MNWSGIGRAVVSGMGLVLVTSPFAGDSVAAGRIRPSDSAPTAPEPFIRISPDGRGFQLGAAGARFVPWGFNYDRDHRMRLLEDYWHEEWETVAGDFREMKALGANVVRVHLQFGRFMRSVTEPDAHNLAQLDRLLALAEQTGLYLNLTGLGCYHKQAVPPWYDALSEAERWSAQAVFWQAVATRCARSPAVFCYDLMNEPVVPAGRNPPGGWLGPPFAGKHYVQFISLESTGRDRPSIGRQWVERLVQAIRVHDTRHLVTVGLVDWSLDRPGLTSGMVPARIAGPLDFLCVHLYPRTGKQREDLETLAGFTAVGKPVVIEETFPLQCSMASFAGFIEASRPHAAGWLGFYWGKTIEELGAGTNSLADALTKQWLEFFQAQTPRVAQTAPPATLTPFRTNHGPAAENR